MTQGPTGLQINDQFVLDRITQAIAQKSFDALMAVPITPPAYEALFKNASDLSARLVGTPVITVHGTAADAEFVYDLKGNTPARGNFDQRLRFHAKMQRTEQHWIILSVGAAP